MSDLVAQMLASRIVPVVVVNDAARAAGLADALVAGNLPVAEVTLPMGPVASQEAIKVLGTNGGGFFNANSAHPFENPTELVNLLQMLAIFLIPAGLTHAFGRLAGDRRQGWALYAAMSVIFIACAIGVMAAAGCFESSQPQAP